MGALAGSDVTPEGLMDWGFSDEMLPLAIPRHILAMHRARTFLHTKHPSLDNVLRAS